LCQYNNLLFIVRRTQHCGPNLSYTIISKATCFNHLGLSSVLQNVVSYNVRLLLLPTESRGLQYANYKIYYIKIFLYTLSFQRG